MEFYSKNVTAPCASCTKYEPSYIFFNYSTSNSDRTCCSPAAFDTVEKLYKNDYKVFYDVGIKYDEDYDDSVRTAIKSKNCKCFVTFTTPESLGDKKYRSFIIEAANCKAPKKIINYSTLTGRETIPANIRGILRDPDVITVHSDVDLLNELRKLGITTSPNDKAVPFITSVRAVSTEPVFKGFHYEIGANGTATLTKYTGKDENICIPAAIDASGGTVEVECLGTSLFSGTDIHSVTIPGNICYIGKYCFSNCCSLSTVSIEDNLENDGNLSIGEHAFGGCVNLSTVYLSNAVGEIRENAFEGCKNLVTVTLNYDRTTVVEKAFNKCGNLHSFIAPDIHFVNPDNDRPFNGNIKITVYCRKDSDLEKHAKKNRIPYSITDFEPVRKSPDKKIIFVKRNFKYIIENNKTVIVGYNDKGAKKIRVPKRLARHRVSAVYESAFKGLEMLESVKILGNPDIGDAVFYGCGKLKKIRFCGSPNIRNKNNLFTYSGVDDPDTELTLSCCLFSKKDVKEFVHKFNKAARK